VILTEGSRLDDEDFEALYLRYKPVLARFAARQRASDPEGVADSALFDAYRAFERLEHRTEPAFRSYLFRAARSHAIADRRRRDVNPVELADDDLVEESAIDEMIEADWVRDLVAQLPPDQRAVVESRFFRDMTAEATGRQLNKSPNAVYQLQHRALRRLRATILAAVTVVALVLALWALRQQLGAFSLVDQSPVERSVVLTPTTVEDLGDRVDAEGRDLEPTTTPPSRPTSAVSSPSRAGREDTPTSSGETGGIGGPATASTTGPMTPNQERPVPTSSDPTGTAQATPQTVPTTSPAEPTSPPTAPTATCNGLPATIVGAGKFSGTNGDDVIVGSAGKDEIRGLGGNDTICGGDGKDKLFGDDGDDVLIGGPGDDKLRGGAGTNTLIDEDN
jgi:RNA polymerase sigma factor (sigma-70 family)